MIRIACMVLLLCALTATAQKARPRTAAEIVADHAAALGDAESVKSLSAESTLEVGGTRVTGVTTLWRRPLQWMSRVRLPGSGYVRSEHFVDDKAYIASWTIKRYRPGQVTSRAAWYFMRAMAEPFPLLPYVVNAGAQAGLKVGDAPGGEVEVLFTPRDSLGVRAIYLIDAETHLIRNLRFEEKDNEPFVNITFDQYRPVDGIALPHSIHGTMLVSDERSVGAGFKFARQRRSETVTRWTVNPPLEDAKFQPPGVAKGGGQGFERIVMPTGPEPEEAGAGDFDGDGRLDVAVACFGGLWIHFGGRLDQPEVVRCGAGKHRGLVVEDLDRDGRLEVVTASWVDPPRDYFVHTHGEKAPRTLRAAPHGAYTLRCADLDRDGLGDLVATGWAAATLEIHFGNGAGGIRTAGSLWPLNATQENSGRRGFGLDIGHVDGNSIPDIAVADGKRVVIFQGQPNGSFQPTLAVDLPADLVGLLVDVALADLDLDGRDELLLANSHPVKDPVHDLIVVHNREDELKVHAGYRAADRAESLATGHFNGDRYPDVVLSSYLSGEISVLMNDGAGGFGKPQRFVSGRGTNRVTVVDFDGDGRDDILASNSVDDTVAVFLNKCTEGDPPSRAKSVRAEACARTDGIEFKLEGLSDPYEFVAEFRLPLRIVEPSGIAALGGDPASSQFVVVGDDDAAMYRLTLDRARRRLLVGPRIDLEGLPLADPDLEAVDFDRSSGTLFFACESDSSVVRSTLYGQVLGQAPTQVPGASEAGIEALVVRRMKDGTPLLYAFRERIGVTLQQPSAHLFDMIGSPFRLEPRGDPLQLPVKLPDQVGAAIDGANGRLFVVSRAARMIAEGRFLGFGFDPQFRIASFRELTDTALALQEPQRPIFGTTEGIAVDANGDLFLVVDNNESVVGKEGLNRGKEGRLLWLRNLGTRQPRAVPNRVRVMQIHVPWKDSKGSHGATRTREEARTLAEDCYRRALAGEEFEQLADRFHDQDSGMPPSLTVVARGTKAEPGERTSRSLPTAFARLIFRLDVGEVGICQDHVEESPFGWHVVKRIE